MSTNITAPIVAADDDILAAEWNEMRDDIIVNAGDYETAGGDGNTVTLAIDSSIVAYAAGQKFRFQANAANTGAVTLNVNSIGAQTIKKYSDQDLVLGDIENGQEIEVVYDGTDMQLLTPVANGVKNIVLYTAGETIDATTKALAVYLKISDGKVYKTDASAWGEEMFRFIGFVLKGENVSADDEVRVIQGEGEVVSGFSGLTINDEQLETDTAGGVDNTGGTKKYKVARAISATEMVIETGAKIVDGSYTTTSDVDTLTNTDIAITLGFKPKRVTCVGNLWAGSNPVTESWNNQHINADVQTSAWWVNGTTYGVNPRTDANDTTYLIQYTNNTNISKISVNAVDNNSLTFRWTHQRDLAGQESVINFRYIIEG